ncbi:MAG: hypothetical protein ABSG60_10705 [Terracidiphilus sp.]|jgi:hypothetical protein
MTDQKIYRIAGISALACIATFFIEFPFYLVRSPFPGLAASDKLADFAARNGTNIMCCVFLDFIILTLIMVFFAGVRHLIRQANPQHEWLASLFFGVGLVYVTLTLVADSLQASTVIDALNPPADGVIIRAMMESMLLMYGAVALWLMAFFMAILSYVTQLSGVLPRWSAWVGYACALACLAFVPAMFVHHVDLYGFYNPAGWGAEAIANGFPLAVWMIVVGILMLRKAGKRDPAASQAH